MGKISRPIIGTTPTGAGATYIMLDRNAEKVTIHLTVNGTVSDYDLDVTADQIQFGGLGSAGAGNAQFVNNTDRVAPASANWVATDVNAEAAAAQQDLATPYIALRILINAGTGSVSYRILQTG